MFRSQWVALLLTVWSAQAHAGPAFFPGTLDGKGGFTAAGRERGFSVRFADLAAIVNDAEASVELSETVLGPAEGTVTTVAVMPLPEGAREVVVLLNGEPVKGELLTPKAGSTLLSSIAEGLGSAAVLTRVGQPLWVASGVTLKPRNRVSVRLKVAAATAEGMGRLVLPLPPADLSREPLRRLTATIRLSARAPLRGVLCPSHEVEVERPSPRQAVVRLSQDQVSSGEPMTLLYTIDEDSLGLRVLTHRRPGEALGYFMVLGNPSGSEDEPKPLPKELVLVVDTSGSMRGEKMAQVRLAVEDVLDRLNPEDRFALMAFGTEVRRAREGLSAPTPDAIAQAKAFMDDQIPLGRTNISEALAMGLAGTPTERPRFVIFLTDGAPTAGELNPEQILKMLPALNTSKAKVFVMGVGHDVDTHLLDRLAERTQGTCEYAEPGEEIDVKVASLYDGLSHPVLSEVQVKVEGVAVQELHPAQVGTLFRGKELLVLGRYAKGGKAKVKVVGKVGPAARTFEVEADFPTPESASGGSLGFGFVGHLWATRQIAAVLRQIRLEGATPERVGAVVDLSTRFGILTESTSFIAEVGAVLDEGQAEAMTTRNLEQARGQTSGAWAVKQSANEASLAKRKASSDMGNAFVDRAGAVKKAGTVRLVGGRAFYKQADGRWIEGGARKPAPASTKTRRVKRFSPEYFKMVETEKDFAEAQSLDGDMTIELKSERVEVY